METSRGIQEVLPRNGNKPDRSKVQKRKKCFLIAAAAANASNHRRPRGLSTGPSSQSRCGFLANSEPWVSDAGDRKNMKRDAEKNCHDLIAAISARQIPTKPRRVLSDAQMPRHIISLPGHDLH